MWKVSGRGSRPTMQSLAIRDRSMRRHQAEGNVVVPVAGESTARVCEVKERGLIRAFVKGAG